MLQPTLFDTLREEIASTPGGIVPRDYQAFAIQKAFDLFAQGSEGCIIRQPTGSGKTVTGTLIARDWLDMGKDHRVLICAHERQLVHQFADEVEDILGQRPGIEMEKEAVKASRIPQITVASRATLYEREVENENGEKEKASRLYKFDNQRHKWLLILDEVHRWLWSLKSCRHILGWFSQNPNSRRLGLTATPERGDKISLKKVVPDVAADYPLYDLDGGPCAVRDGWAVPYDQRFVIVEGVDFNNIREVTKDFDKNELEAILGERQTLLKLVTPTLDLVEDRRTIIFSPTVNMAKWVAHTINETRPDQAVSLDGSAPDHRRKDVYCRHQHGEFQFLSVCGLCREGYNDPGIQAVAVFRPTKSRPLAEQMKGRGCRPLRGLVDRIPTAEERKEVIAQSTKPNCMIIDLVGITGMADCASTAHVLGAGKADEVIERANENALNIYGPIDMAEEIRKAQHEIDEEREWARQERLEREAREKEEAARRAKLRAEVRYTSRQVEQGRGSRQYQGRRRAYMPFGKHRGRRIDKIPHDYLQWLLKQKIAPWLRSAAERELGKPNGKPKGTMPVEDVNRMLQEVGH